MRTLMNSTLDLRNFFLESQVSLIIICHIILMSANGLATAREVHGSHTHGVANLTLAFERGILEVQFESPAMSILGFEHKPKTQQQRASIEISKVILESPEKVLSIAGANCSPNSVAVDVLGPAGQPLNSDHKNDHSHQDAEYKRVEHGVSHSEVSAVYVFSCAVDETLPTVNILLFEHFFGLEKIKVNWVTENKQGQAVLSSESSVVEFFSD